MSLLWPPPNRSVIHSPVSQSLVRPHCARRIIDLTVLVTKRFITTYTSRLLVGRPGANGSHIRSGVLSPNRPPRDQWKYKTGPFYRISSDSANSRGPFINFYRILGKFNPPAQYSGIYMRRSRRRGIDVYYNKVLIFRSLHAVNYIKKKPHIVIEKHATLNRVYFFVYIKRFLASNFNR